MKKNNYIFLIKILLILIYIAVAIPFIETMDFDIFTDSHYYLKLIICEILGFQILGWLIGLFVNEYITTKIVIDKKYKLSISLLLLIFSLSLPIWVILWKFSIAAPLLTPFIAYSRCSNILSGIFVVINVKQKKCKLNKPNENNTEE